MAWHSHLCSLLQWVQYRIWRVSASPAVARSQTKGSNWWRRIFDIFEASICPGVQGSRMPLLNTSLVISLLWKNSSSTGHSILCLFPSIHSKSLPQHGSRGLRKIWCCFYRREIFFFPGKKCRSLWKVECPRIKFTFTFLSFFPFCSLSFYLPMHCRRKPTTIPPTIRYPSLAST